MDEIKGGKPANAWEISKTDYNLPLDEWHTPWFQKTSYSHPGALPRDDSRLRESEL
jgi:hypothetical protein